MNNPVLIPNAPLQEATYRPVQLAENQLTKREEFAKAAMQGLMANSDYTAANYDAVALHARRQADALIAELDAHPNP